MTVVPEDMCQYMTNIVIIKGQIRSSSLGECCGRQHRFQLMTRILWITLQQRRHFTFSLLAIARTTVFLTAKFAYVFRRISAGLLTECSRRASCEQKILARSLHAPNTLPLCLCPSWEVLLLRLIRQVASYWHCERSRRNLVY